MGLVDSGKRSPSVSDLQGYVRVIRHAISVFMIIKNCVIIPVPNFKCVAMVIRTITCYYGALITINEGP